MNFKKILILPIGFLFTTFAYIACCHCAPVNEHYYLATGFTIKPSGSKNTIVDNGVTVNMDSLYLDVDFNTNCVATHQNAFSFLVNTANACSCEGCGDRGLKHPLSNIDITSNNIYNGLPSGTSLNNYFKTYNKYYNSYQNISIDSLKTLINKNSFSLYNINLFTKTKPANNLNHQLTVTATFANGITLSSKTRDINWQ